MLYGLPHYNWRFHMKTRFLLFTACLLIVFSSCSSKSKENATVQTDPAVSSAAINPMITDNNPEPIENRKDSLVLRTPCTDLAPEAVASEEYKVLEKKLIATVTSPEQDGVGIAGPQVGLLRRVVAVQRFDKEGEPFEVYPNIRVIRTRGEMAAGGEGCLSVPNRRGEVLRYQDIDISYTSPFTLKDTTETIKGFTAVIFQHETDHLDGVLYIDKLVAE